jgi:hypothetical protein
MRSSIVSALFGCDIAGQRLLPPLRDTLLGGRAGLAVARIDLEPGARHRHFGEAEADHGVGGTRFLDPLALVVDERLDAAPGRARHHGVADAQRALADQQRGRRPCARRELGLHDVAFRQTAARGLQFEHLGLEQDHLQQVIDALARQRADRATHHGAAPVLGCQVDLLKLLLHAVGIRGPQVHLVDRHDDRNAGRLRVIDGLDGLRHHAVTAATTSTAMSVTLAPRARMAVNASWPGVSRKVMRSLPCRLQATVSRRRCAG